MALSSADRPAALFPRLFLIAASAAFGFAATVHIATYGPPAWADFIEGAEFATVAPIFPVFGAVVILGALKRIQMDQLFRTLPAWVKVVGAFAVAYLFLDFFWMISQLPGQPNEQGGSFFLNNHGSHIPVSETAYRQALMYQARLVSGHAVFFSGFAAAVAYQMDRAARGINLEPRIETSIPVPTLPAPFSRSTTLQSALSPGDCAARLHARIAPAAGAWFAPRSGSDLAGAVSPIGFRLNLPYGRGGGMVSARGVFELRDGATLVHEVVGFRPWALLSILGSVPILLIAAAIVFHGESAFVLFALVGGSFVTALNLGIGLRDMTRLRSIIARAVEAVPTSATN